MYVLEWLTRGLRGAASAVRKQRSGTDPVKLHGRGAYAVDVVGESFYTEAFKLVLGPAAYTHTQVHCLAVLRLLDDNAHDGNAVGVYVRGHQVGHLSREDAVRFRRYLWNHNLTHHRALAVDAQLYGGDERGRFSARLDLLL